MTRNITTNHRRRDDLNDYWFEKIAVESKTAEEIRAHTVPENLTPVAKTLALLDSQSDIQRLAGIRSVPSIVISYPVEGSQQILPKFKAIIEQTVDSEEHVVGAEAIVLMIQQQALSYSDFMSCFSQMICGFLFPTTTNRFSTDFGGIWCQALCNTIDAFPSSTLFTSLLDLIFNRILHGSYVRDRLAIILAKLSYRLPSQAVENRLLPVFKNFINDTNADIRALACEKLPILAQSLESDKVSTLILPLLVILSKDENLTVRQTCLESLLILHNELNEPKWNEQVREMITSLVKFGLSSRTSTFLTSIAVHLPEICHAFTIFNVNEASFIQEMFLRLTQEKNIPACRLACAKHFTSVVDYLDHEQFTRELEDTFLRFCKDNDVNICSTMPSTIITLAKLYCNKNEKNDVSIIWNGFLMLLENTNHDVMFAIARHLLDIFKIFSRDKSEGFINGTICSTSAVPDPEIFVNSLLEYERRIFEMTLSWRSYILCLQAFVHLPCLLSSELIQTKILPRIFSRIFTRQVCVREVAVDSYVQSLRKIPRRSVRKNAFQKLKTDLLLNKSYQWRLMYIKVCRQILVHYSKRFFKENFLETVLSIGFDPVLNVRIQFIPLLIEIKSILRLPADRQSISRIETMMECFLASKTITLHDLANNGLLQLDQIRSYKPISVFSAHSSDDENDQNKENEEELLDELDSSSRRSSNKSNEQYAITKRLTDTTISNKPNPPVKSPRLSKPSSDEQHRRLSVTKQRRRQSLVDSTASRIPHQTTIKKNIKCMKTILKQKDDAI
ncbi:unnamed protein product [Adineta ricciae]|uniref:Phosphatase PP2A regulatory subunit A/Splicing factor 3B subunit 1-like HEAT repeat domain-containing protein n=1 Tax=Adineta ricciae TaxID=249248 RepID=A0A814L1I2_ADIRI|nr:unnamed protein product [Adineta ricciae]